MTKFNLLRSNRLMCLTRTVLSGAVLIMSTILMGGCASETLLSAQFNNDALDEPPAIDQEVGQVRTGDFGTVRVAPAPGVGITGHWVQLTQAQEFAPPASLRGIFSAMRGDGNYLVAMRLFIPSQMAAFVLFEESGFNPSSFLSIELPTSGIFRAPGSDSIAGHFPHDQAFSIAVNLNIGPSSTATVTLLGPAHGSIDIDIPPQVNTVARLFSVVRLNTDPGIAGDTFFANDLSTIFHKP